MAIINVVDDFRSKQSMRLPLTVAFASGVPVQPQNVWVNLPDISVGNELHMEKTRTVL